MQGITENPKIQQLNAAYNWLIGLAVFFITGPVSSYLTSGQVLTWQGLGLAVLAGVTTYITTRTALKTPVPAD